MFQKSRGGIFLCNLCNYSPNPRFNFIRKLVRPNCVARDIDNTLVLVIEIKFHKNTQFSGQKLLHVLQALIYKLSPQHEPYFLFCIIRLKVLGVLR